jgi:hypothetical protein
MLARWGALAMNMDSIWLAEPPTPTFSPIIVQPCTDAASAGLWLSVPVLAILAAQVRATAVSSELTARGRRPARDRALFMADTSALAEEVSYWLALAADGRPSNPARTAP